MNAPTCVICRAPAPSLLDAPGFVYCADCRQAARADREHVARLAMAAEEGRDILAASLAEHRALPEEERPAKDPFDEADYERQIRDLDETAAHYRGLLATSPKGDPSDE